MLMLVIFELSSAKGFYPLYSWAHPAVNVTVSVKASKKASVKTFKSSLVASKVAIMHQLRYDAGFA